jgi:hypothetical protein
VDKSTFFVTTKVQPKDSTFPLGHFLRFTLFLPASARVQARILPDKDIGPI